MALIAGVAGFILWLFATFHTKVEAMEQQAQMACSFLRIQSQTELTSRRVLDQQRFEFRSIADARRLTTMEKERLDQLNRELTDMDQSLVHLKIALSKCP